MLTMKRRDMLLGAAAASVVLSGGVAVAANRAGSDKPVITVYSADFPRAQDLARKNAGRANRIEPLKGDLIAFYKARLASHRGAIEGYTSWSDYLLLRGLAEEQGLRLRAETQLPGASGKSLFHWVMA
ncbi:hypothetical protein [Hyphococcus luteus]|uniref:ABC transporter substrate-binding protein n=1 Tax=Hyphococcus luteus TaxID=2058213 RepID=A0A2S7K0P9_9PROT|nr:hypothetical protein [Marinicaulis flavus]PQA86079.1 hypothetical protein CW354_17055 [Marinicaulis flavus]